MKPGFSRAIVCVLFCLASVLPGCFTLGFWGVEIQQEEPPEEGLDYTRENGPPLTAGYVATRILLTPIGLLLDLVTLPVQCVYYGKMSLSDLIDGDDGDCD